MDLRIHLGRESNAFRLQLPSTERTLSYQNAFIPIRLVCISFVLEHSLANFLARDLLPAVWRLGLSSLSSDTRKSVPSDGWRSTLEDSENFIMTQNKVLIYDTTLRDGSQAEEFPSQ